MDRNGKHVGTWRFWDPDGTLRTQRAWDEQGRPHGRHVSFHPDSSLAHEFRSKHGKMLQVTHHAAVSGRERFAPKLPFAVARNVVKAEYVPAPKARQGWEWRFYDKAGDRVDDAGNPVGVSRAIDTQVRTLPEQFRAQSGETFEQAIARANGWYGKLIALRSKAVQSAYGRHSVAVWSISKPATRSQLDGLTRWIGGPLPPSYRRFLKNLGCIKFIDRLETMQISQIRKASERYTEHSFAESFARARRLDGRPWAKAKPHVVVGFREQELADPPFLQIAPESEGGYLLVPHARDRRGEAPVVRHYSDDGTTAVSLAGHSFDGWVSVRVDELISELTQQFA